MLYPKQPWRVVRLRAIYRMSHFFFSFLRVSRAARVACSKTSLTPSFVLAEHSRYLSAPIFLRTSSAWRVSTKVVECGGCSMGLPAQE